MKYYLIKKSIKTNFLNNEKFKEGNVISEYDLLRTFSEDTIEILILQNIIEVNIPSKTERKINNDL